MEVADVELVAHGLLRLGAERGNLELTDFIRECLAGPNNVAIDFSGNFQLLLGAAFRHVVDGLLPIRLLVMHTVVDDQSAGAPDLIHQLTEL